jgi:hypothetical protein
MKKETVNLTPLQPKPRSARRKAKTCQAVAVQQADHPIINLFAWSIALVTILAFSALLTMKYLRPHEDITVFQTICVTTLGSMTTILTVVLKRKR